MNKQKLIKADAMSKIGGKTMDNYQNYLSDVIVIMSIMSRRYA